MANRLSGVRLGRHGRLLLESAGSTLGVTPTLIDLEAPRSTQQGLLRASLKLASAGLIERHQVYRERRARTRVASGPTSTPGASGPTAIPAADFACAGSPS